MGERCGVFLTAPTEQARGLIERARVAHPDAELVAYYRATDRAQLGDALDHVRAVDDKPRGSRLAFLRAIRAERFAVAYVAWTGANCYDRMKVVALLSGARHLIAVDAGGQPMPLRGMGLLRLRRVRWRPAFAAPQSTALSSVLILLYKWTLGLLLGAAWILARFVWWRWIRRERSQRRR